VFVAGGPDVGDLEEREGVKGEPRGAGVTGHPHNELYRYDAADGSVTCVSCGEGVAPAEGEMLESKANFGAYDQAPPFIQMSEDGQRVFFQTTAQLVAQDTNSPEEEGAGGAATPGMDVYEWEADGVEEGEGTGVFCRVVNGCTHLLSSGEDVGKATFLGASENGSNVFFATAARLVPQATPEFPNIYDARVDGGFPPPTKEIECLSCQGVGSPSPLFGAPASGTFVGTGNPAPAVAVVKAVVKPKKKKKKAKAKAKKQRAKKSKSMVARRERGRASASRGVR
jgi:hypothetical protein